MTVQGKLALLTRLIRNLEHFFLIFSDLYQITMAYAYWKSEKRSDIAVFDLFFRKNPFKGEFTIFAGLEECLKFLQNFHYSENGKKISVFFSNNLIITSAPMDAGRSDDMVPPNHTYT